MEATFTQRQNLLKKTLQTLGKQYKAPARGAMPSIDMLELIMWTSISDNPFNPNVKRAFKKLVNEYVDWNEVRITSTNELGELLTGCKLEASHAINIKNAAQEIFHRENRLSLDFLSPKRPADVRKYIGEMKSIPEAQANTIMILITDSADVPPIAAVRRVAQRIGIVFENSTDNAVRLVFKKTLQKIQGFSAFYLICQHAYALCKETGPRCSACDLNKICEFGKEKISPRK